MVGGAIVVGLQLFYATNGDGSVEKCVFIRIQDLLRWANLSYHKMPIVKGKFLAAFEQRRLNIQYKYMYVLCLQLVKARNKNE